MRRILIGGLIAMASALGMGGCAGYGYRTVVVAEESTPVYGARVYFRNGMHLYERRYYDQATVQFQLAIDQDPSYWEADYYLGDCNYRLGYYDRAVTYYDKVLVLQSDPVWVTKVQYNIGVVYEKQGNYGDARSRYELALKANPDYGPAKQRHARLMSKKFKQDKDENDRGRGKKKGRND